MIDDLLRLRKEIWNGRHSEYDAAEGVENWQIRNSSSSKK